MSAKAASASVLPPPTDEQIAARKNRHAACERCPLGHRQYKYVAAAGNARDPQAIVVGEAPGTEEVIERMPFVGASGKVLRATLKRVGIDPKRVWYTNAVGCHPPNNKLDDYKDAIACCRPRLEHELSVIGNADTPVIAAGRTSVESVVKLTQGSRAPRTVKITSERGTWFHPTDDGSVQKRTLATVHPAYVLRAPNVMPDFESDLRTVTQGIPEHKLQHAPRVRWLHTLADMDAAFAEIADGEWIAFDVETSNLIWYTRPGRQETLLMIGIARGSDEGLIIGQDLLYSAGRDVQKRVNALFERVRTCAHNGKFDVLWLRRWGFTAARVDFDTMLAHYTLHETPPHGLKELAHTLYHVEDYESAFVTKYFPSQKREDRDYSLVPPNQLAHYLAWDLAVTYQLFRDFGPAMQQDGAAERTFNEILMPASSAFVRLEEYGVLIDRPYLESVRTVMERDSYESLMHLREMTGRPHFNPNSTQQVAAVLFDDLGFKPTTSKHFPYRSTSAGALKQADPALLAHPFTQEFQKHRRIKKLLSAYVQPMLDFADVNDYLHPSYRLIGTETGRLSAVDPAIQTLPRAARDVYGPMIRASVIAPPGYKLVLADYSQAEMRVWAHLCQDPFLLQVYRDGRDLHTEGAIHLFGPNYTKEQRTWVKNYNFAYVYGGNEYSFAGQYNLPIETAREFVHEYERMMPVARAWRRTAFEDAVNRGYVETPFGRKRRFPLINEETLEEIKKVAWNFPPQSIASDLTLLSTIKLVEMNVRVVLTVHDSIGAYVRDEDVERIGALMRSIMIATAEQWVPSVPWEVDVEVQDRWALRTDDDLALIGEVV